MAVVLSGRISRWQHQQPEQEFHPAWSAPPYLAAVSIRTDYQVNLQSHRNGFANAYSKARFGSVFHDAAYRRRAASI